MQRITYFITSFAKLKTAIIMIKAYRCILPLNVQNYSEYMNHDIHPGINVSSSKSMYVLRTNLKSMCISVTGIKLWNSLDNSLTSCKKVIISKSVIQIDC